MILVVVVAIGVSKVCAGSDWSRRCGAAPPGGALSAVACWLLGRKGLISAKTRFAETLSQKNDRLFWQELSMDRNILGVTSLTDAFLFITP